MPHLQQNELIPGGKVIIQKRKCDVAHAPFPILDHDHVHHHVIQKFVITYLII